MRFPAFLLMAVALTTVGCKSPTKYVDPGNNEGLVNVDRINTQDWTKAADGMIASLKASGVLGPAGSERKVLMISKISNETRQHIDTDLLTKKIRVALSKTGRVVTSTAVGQGDVEEPGVKTVRDLRSDDEFDGKTLPNKGELKAPRYGLSGKIIENLVRDGKNQQSTISFQLSLTDLKTGLAEWEEEVEISKYGGKATFGW